MPGAELTKGMTMPARQLLAAALLGAMAVPAVAAGPAGPEIPRPPTTLDLSASAEVSAAPDIATVSAGVVTQAEDAAAALAANSARMTAVLAAVRKAGVKPADIQTSRLSLQPKYVYQQNEAPRLTGFEASNQVQVTLHDVSRIGAVIDALVAAGGNRIEGPNFRVSNAEALLDNARAEAVTKARARAELYARAAGLRVTGISRISEDSGSSAPVPMPRMMAMAAEAPTPVEAGVVNLSVTVSMQFELAPR